MDVISKKSHGRRNGHGYSQKTANQYQQGLTLYELMTVLAVLSITISSGIPNLTGFLNNNRVANEINQLSGSLRYAWSEAITRNQVVVACPSPDGQQCVKSKDWDQGWLIFVDRNDNRQLDEDDPIKRVYDAMPEGITASFSAFGPRGQYIPFYPTEGMRTNGTFSFCMKNNPELSRALIVSKARPRVSKTLRTGKPVKCPS